VLIELHWLRIRERIDYKLAIMVYRCLHGTAPTYLAQMFTRTSAVSARRQQRFSSAAIASGFHRFCAPTFRLVAVGGRALDVVDASVWNSLPADITSADTISAFRKRLKTFLFRQSFPDIDITSYRWLF
jgi:hypothetical protein